MVPRLIASVLSNGQKGGSPVEQWEYRSPQAMIDLVMEHTELSF